MPACDGGAMRKTVGLAGSILEAAEDFRSAHGGELDVIYSERGGTARQGRATTRED